MSLAADLNGRMGLKGVAEVVEGQGGLPLVRVTGDQATGEVYLHGAHVTAWKPAGFEEVLWLSSKSAWQDTKAIRGGVPLCFPWFGPRAGYPDAPMHGFARITAWTLESITRNAADVTVTLSLKSDEKSRQAWGHDFTLWHRITFGGELTMAIELTNTGEDMLTAEVAQHTYFSVGDVRQICIRGLDGTHYIDKTDAFKKKPQSGDIQLASETNRIYLNTASDNVIEDPVKRRRITVTKGHSLTTVVWNPWSTAVKTMGDFPEDQWPHMVCVETCNVGDYAVKVEPGQTHVMSTRLAVKSM